MGGLVLSWLLWTDGPAAAQVERSILTATYQDRVDTLRENPLRQDPPLLEFDDGQLEESVPPVEEIWGPDSAFPEPGFADEGHGHATRGGPRLPLRVNPFAIQQGMAQLAFDDGRGDDQQRLGFPFTALPRRLFQALPRIQFAPDFPPGRASGRGEPLVGTSWRNRPFHADFFMGGFFPGEMISGLGPPEGGTLIGGRLGWDAGHYFGGEFRMGLADATLTGAGTNVDIRLWDLHWQYYPWGDARFRPYTSVGLGIAEFRFIDSFGNQFDATTVNVPLSIGIKYYFKQWLTMRLEVEDNIAFGSQQLRSMHNFGLTGGIEFRFGGTRKTYFPYNSSRVVF